MSFEFSDNFNLELFDDLRTGSKPPLSVLQPVAVLAANDVHVGVGECNSFEESTRWRITALTRTRLIQVEAHAARSHWDYQNRPATRPSSLSAKAFELTDISRLDVAAVHDLDDQRWTADLVVWFGTTPVALPTTSGPSVARRSAVALSKEILALTSASAE
ncbi:hypothetical protein [Aeromicrobium sp. CnD17-E]|uniref:hypothetical protein n=1 Tax=Aeromicrobium sp. CnD17-E TaxID=2954487 RepID=UPI00209711F2|nr:hypothetical protein [Aeromicrobium sp. CnD17-E]MCO7238795.1 hypothetical protein [Aeromicrobium sp. CnD17-E]